MSGDFAWKRVLVGASVGIAVWASGAAQGDMPPTPIPPWQRNFDIELRAMLTEGLTEEQQRECIAARDELVNIVAEVAKIDEGLAAEAKAWEGAAAVPDDEWMVDLSSFEPAFLPEHPILLRMAREALVRYQAAGLFERIDGASRMPRWPEWDDISLKNWPTDPKADAEAASASLEEWHRGRQAAGKASRLLNSRVRVRAEAGDWDGVVADCTTALRLGRSMCAPRSSGMHTLYGGGFAVHVCRVMIELVSEHRPDAGVLRGLAAVLDHELVLPARGGHFDADCIEFLANRSSDSDPIAKMLWLSSVVASVEEYRDRAAQEAKRSPHERGRAAFDEEAFYLEHDRWLNPMDNDLDGLPSVSTSLRILDRNDCEWRGARLILAIEIFRAEHGALPEALDALAPRFIAAIPPDPYAPDGRFRYKRIDRAVDAEGRDYLLYSVGTDGKDNGGTSPPGDEFWNPYDATNGHCKNCDFIINRKE